MTSWRFPIVFGVLCAAGYIAVLLLQPVVHVPTAGSFVWRGLEWLVGPVVGITLAGLGCREIERPVLTRWQVIAAGVCGATCGALGSVPFLGWADCLPGTGIGIALTVLLGAGFGWVAVLLSGGLVGLMTFAAAASLPTFSSGENWASLLWVFLGSFGTFVPLGRLLQWTFNFDNREMVRERVELAWLALLGRFEGLPDSRLGSLATAGIPGRLQVSVAPTRAPEPEPPTGNLSVEVETLDDPVEPDSPETQTNLAHRALRAAAILEHDFTEPEVAYLDALVRLRNNKALAKHFKVSKAEVKRVLETIYERTEIPSLNLPPVKARAELLDWLEQHGFGADHS